VSVAATDTQRILVVPWIQNCRNEDGCCRSWHMLLEILVHAPRQTPKLCLAMKVWVEYVGSFAAACTTLCWIPQAVKIIRERQTQGISLMTQALFTVGLALWLIYGLLLANWPLIVSNAVTLVLAAVILILKVRFR